MELYDEYENGNIKNLIEFANKTFPSDGTDKFFIGCVLILFSRGGYKSRYNMTRENLLDIVRSAKEKTGSTNLLALYIERINTKKGINKYLNDIVNGNKIDEYADLVIEYLEQFKPSFVYEIKNNKNYAKYIKSDALDKNNIVGKNDVDKFLMKQE